jgi:hypothetical protein
MLATPENSLLVHREMESIAVKTEELETKTLFALPTVSKKREIVKLFRKETAKQAIISFSKNIDVFGFTKGQFSLIELIDAVIDKTGEGNLTISTWTASKADLNNVLDFLEKGRIKSARFLIDFTFQRRSPEVAKRIRDIFGLESLRITRNHAKFFTIGNESNGWWVSCKTSMNLNQNPRFEDFDLSNNKDLYVFLNDLVDELFNQTKIKKQESMTVKELCGEFSDNVN